MEKNLNLISDIQEITLRAKENGIFDTLFNERDMSRPDILHTFACWGREFNETHADTKWGEETFYYDEIDAFLERKRKGEVENLFVDHFGQPYDQGDANRCWPAGGGLHKMCDYNAEALYAYYSVRTESGIRDYLSGRGFEEVDTPSNDLVVYEKGNTRIVFENYDAKNNGGLYGYIHTELIECRRLSQCLREKATIYAVVCAWAEARMAEAEMSLFDLNDTHDYKLFVDMHNQPIAEKCRLESRYWFDGTNYEKSGPQAVTEEDLVRFVDDEVLAYIEDGWKKGFDITYWSELLDMTAVMRILEA